MKAIIEVDIPDYQIGQEVSIYFKDTMVIKGIVQEPSGDLISRQAVLDLLEDTDNGWIINEVVQLPSVTPQEPKTGHWISHREHCEMNNLRPSGLGSYFWCSECDCGIDSKNFSRVNYNYCPNCGCRMVEPQESEEV